MPPPDARSVAEDHPAPPSKPRTVAPGAGLSNNQLMPDSSAGRTRLLMIDDDRKLCRLVATYLDEGLSPDNAGSFLGWLAEREPVYGYRFEGTWYDIGDKTQLLEADNQLRRLAGLPERESYSLD